MIVPDKNPSFPLEKKESKIFTTPVLIVWNFVQQPWCWHCNGCMEMHQDNQQKPTNATHITVHYIKKRKYSYILYTNIYGT